MKHEGDVKVVIDGKEFYRVICQKWEESERGWGTRPDGYSLHLSEEDCEKYIKEYWAGMPDAVPDEYSRPDGNSYSTLVDKSTIRDLKNCRKGKIYKTGVRFYSGPKPEPFDKMWTEIGGWVPIPGGHGKL